MKITYKLIMPIDIEREQNGKKVLLLNGVIDMILAVSDEMISYPLLHEPFRLRRFSHILLNYIMK